MMNSTKKHALGVTAALALLLAAAPAMAQTTHASRGAAPHPTAHAAPSHAATSSTVADGVVNIQTATAEQLQLLPGIGPSKAEAIISYRQAHPFTRVEDILRVRGIGRGTFRRLRSMLTVSGATTMTTDVHTTRARAASAASDDTASE